MMLFENEVQWEWASSLQLESITKPGDGWGEWGTGVINWVPDILFVNVNSFNTHVVLTRRIYFLILKTLLDAHRMPGIRTGGEYIMVKPNQSMAQSHSQSRYVCREIMILQSLDLTRSDSHNLSESGSTGLRHEMPSLTKSPSRISCTSGALIQRPELSTHSPAEARRDAISPFCLHTTTYVSLVLRWIWEGREWVQVSVL